MRPCFADTFYYLALANPSDDAHGRAKAITPGLRRGVVTTEFVLVEVGNAMASPAARNSFLRLLRAQRSGRAVQIIPASSQLLERGVSLFEERPDKDWSVTDCISFVVMREHDLSDALTADHHFEQAGFRALLL